MLVSRAITVRKHHCLCPFGAYSVLGNRHKSCSEWVYVHIELSILKERLLHVLEHMREVTGLDRGVGEDCPEELTSKEQIGLGVRGSTSGRRNNIMEGTQCIR